MSRPVPLSERVPRGRTSTAALLPLLRELTDALVTLASARSKSAGRPVSCRAGCAACCRQLVPVGRAEAQALREVVAGLPAKERARLLERFASAQSKMRDAGLERLKSPSRMSPNERARDAGGDYLRAGLRYVGRWIDCPFLDDERCTIYSARPLACRQYLAISPAEHCRHVELPGVEGLELAAMPFEALTAIDGSDWVALPYALEWTPPSAPLTDGLQLLERALAALAQ